MKELAEKYLNNKCTKEEARKVLRWFQTPEGVAFLEQELDKDIDEVLCKEDTSQASAGDVESVEAEIHELHTISNRNNDQFKWGVLLKAAAAILLILTSISTYWLLEQRSTNAVSQQKFKTGPGQQEKITLADGTKIHLNQNSELWLNSGASSQYRLVRLKGEAFFKVTHNERRPFVVTTGDVRIQDIGTAFDVKSRSGARGIQVAVVDGEVSLESKVRSQQSPIRLTKGQFAYLDAEKNQIKTNHFEVKNYLSWMNNHIVFKDAPLYKVGQQLEHLYDIKSVYASDKLKNLKISADFKGSSEEKVLSVISLTLHIQYSLKKNKVIWREE